MKTQINEVLAQAFVEAKKVAISDISRILLERGLLTDAGRIAGALRVLGDSKKADQILSDMTAAGYSVSETNPFDGRQPVLDSHTRIISPCVGRVQAMWRLMRKDVIDIFPKPPLLKKLHQRQLMMWLQERYTQDAYHSLSIEGYEVTEELIEKIKSK